MNEKNNYHLGINIGFAVNRYPEPRDWLSVVAEIGVKRVQFVADLLNPDLPSDYRAKKVREIVNLCQKHEITIESAFTGAFTRVNHFGSTDREIRNHWQAWFRKYIQQSCDLGVTSIGGHPGILSVHSNSNSKLRIELIKQAAEEWAKLLDFGRPYGLKEIAWEPMSISRELGHTIEDAQFVHSEFKKKIGENVSVCLDLDHGDLESRNPRDTNPISWIETLKNEIGMLHLKQTTVDRRKNMPFTKENNIIGTVNAKDIIAALEFNNVPCLTMYLELNFRERNPDDSTSISANKESAQYWFDAGAKI